MADTIVAIRSVQSGLSEWLHACSSRVNLIDGYLNRVVKRDYLNSQRTRFETANAGADFGGGKWESLDPKYSDYKRRKFAEYPGGGSKINVRSSNLLQSLLLSDQYYPAPAPKRIRPGKGGGSSRGEEMAGSLAVVDSSSIHIYTLVPYAKWVDEKRNFTQWSQVFWDRINKGITAYLTGKVTL